MAAFIDILEPVADPSKAVQDLQDAIADLYLEAWEKDLRPTYGKPFSLNIDAFVSMWFDKGLKLFMAYDEQRKPVGFLIGMVFRPMPYQASVFQVEAWYARDGEATVKQLFDYAVNAVRFIGCDEIWITDDPSKTPPALGSWKIKNEFTMHRYVRE